MIAPVFIVLTSVFGKLTCVNTINIQEPINLVFQVQTDQNDVPKTRQMDIDPVKTMPNLINIDYDSINDINFRAENRELKFTDFILEVAIILKTYDNNVLKEVFALLNDEIGKNVYYKCKSHELVKLKASLSNQLGTLKATPAEILRDHLDNMIKKLKKEDYGDLAETIELVNSLYAGESDKFIKVLMGLMFKKISPGIDLGDIVRRTLRHLLFDHYCNLSNEIRRDLILTIEHYWKQFVNIRVNNKIDRNQNKVTFVTPFDHRERIRKTNKKRRFKTVSHRRSIYKNEKPNSYKNTNKYSTKNYKLEQRRFKIASEGRPIINKDDKPESYEHATKYSTKNYKLLSSEKAKDYLGKIQEVPKMQEIRLRSSISASALDPELANMIRNKSIQDLFLDYNDNKNKVIKDSLAELKIKYETAQPPVKILRQPDLDKLRNIRALAEEINVMIVSEEKATAKHEALRVGKDVTEERGEDISDMRASNKKIERQGGASDLQPLSWNLPLEFSNGNINITTEISKNITDGDAKERKGLVVSVNVKYN